MAVGGAFTNVRAATTVVSIDPTQTYQTMTGFGASLTDSGAAALAKLNPAAQASLMSSLFSANTGAGLSFLRQPMGASDFRTVDYTYDDVSPGGTDYSLNHFSIAHDTMAYSGSTTSIVSLLQTAEALNPQLSVMGTPWTAPGWMKTGAATDIVPQAGVDERLYGGTLSSDPQVLTAYANYFVKYVQAYAAQGIKIGYITPQNEPFYDGGSVYPAMSLTPTQQASLIKAIGQAFSTAVVNPALPYNAVTNPHIAHQTKIEAIDHNWSDTVDGNAPSTNVTTLLNDPSVAQYIDGIAFHGYSGDVSAQTIVHDAYPSKAIFFTEQTGTVGSDFSTDLMYDMRNLVVGGTRDWASTIVKFNLALDETNGPKTQTVTINNGDGTTTTVNSGFDDGRGVVTVNSTTGAITYNEEYYALAHIAKFVEPGAVRIASDSDHSVAFVNPDHTTALVAYNDDSEAIVYRFDEGATHFDYALPLRIRVATFSWSSSQRGAPIAVYLTTGDQQQLLARQADVAFVPEPAELAALCGAMALLRHRVQR